MENSIIISPTRDCSPEILLPIGTKIQHIFGYRTEIRPLLENVEFALDTNRKQYESTKILDKLARRVPAYALRVLAITAVDLFIPILTHVYGQAQLGGRACIISTYRLKEGLFALPHSEAYLVRIVKEALHELGHTFQLRHCPDPACLMHYCRSIADVDRKSDRMCRYCSVLIKDELNRLGR